MARRARRSTSDQACATPRNRVSRSRCECHRQVALNERIHWCCPAPERSATNQTAGRSVPDFDRTPGRAVADEALGSIGDLFLQEAPANCERTARFSLVEPAARTADFGRAAPRPVCVVEELGDDVMTPEALQRDACAAHDVTLPRRRAPVVYDTPSYAPAAGANVEELTPAPPRLPDPESDLYFRPRLRVPDFATYSAHPLDAAADAAAAAALLDPGAPLRGPGRYEVPAWLLTGRNGPAANFARGHAFPFYAAEQADSTGLKQAEGDVLDLHPRWALVRRAVRRVGIAREGRQPRRAAPGEAHAEAVRAQNALELGAPRLKTLVQSDRMHRRGHTPTALRCVCMERPLHLHIEPLDSDVSYSVQSWRDPHYYRSMDASGGAARLPASQSPAAAKLRHGSQTR